MVLVYWHGIALKLSLKFRDKCNNSNDNIKISMKNMLPSLFLNNK